MSKPRKEHGLQKSNQAKAALKSLATNLKAARIQAKLKPEELAQKVGCSKQVIYHIESEDCYPSFPVYIAMLVVLKQPLPPLVSGVKTKKAKLKVMEII
jgi:DNA-binding XRE family transcriptional regulator